ncbi:hypothetical protein ANANG_G00293860 [Anguilla anguilla]|uniref:MADF domain-containing protein n=1 Tax=Anguilla anguilla TaxID=7936 RepID=A0A9D3RJF2_ANGAN|nr:hypothetical protein ANANG_G00293860 [Anguilla anguilla]
MSFLTGTDEETVRLIRLRAENDNLFTGKRHAAGKAWKEILRQMGLQGRELRSSAAGTGTDRESPQQPQQPPGRAFLRCTRPSAGSLSIFSSPTDLRVAENPTHVADEASDAGGSSLVDLCHS